MSAPPPGGTPPPQQPPTYPQYPQQPPQGYPPQYPQQPYYPQPVPQQPKSNTALIVVLVVVVIVVVLAVLAWWAITTIMAPVTTNSQITITGVSFVIYYPGANQYFGASPITSCSTCPFQKSIFTQFEYTLTLTNSDSRSHNVTSIVLAGTSFTLISTSPSVSTLSPLVVPAGSTQSIILTIQPSTLGGSYTLSGTVYTA